jgi:hypothetical protein
MQPSTRVSSRLRTVKANASRRVLALVHEHVHHIVVHGDVVGGPAAVAPAAQSRARLHDGLVVALDALGTQHAQHEIRGS